MASALNSCYLWELSITFVLLMQINAFDGMKFFLVIVDGKFYFWFRGHTHWISKLCAKGSLALGTILGVGG